MLKILLPVDGSDNSDKTVSEFIQLLDWYKEKPELHLLNVQYPLDGNVSLFINQSDITQYHQEEGLKSLQSARDLLDQAGISYQHHITVGSPAEMIVRFAVEKQYDQIVMGPRGKGGIQGMLLGSVTNKVMQLSNLPVLLVR
ncbi:universal stress protein [Nitrosomonas ureae]|uniref:Nucleotide-binding universal stress UspA family protein n=1 Tax=Nitrosomonas ureae TaxID=44577 RepID=A0A1H9DEV4_9PROT|nr:universal stress protein [Nitrosomonas ureae]PTQ82632.1 nucleotide-binding universal stress UspA family protein [Nitrosomonas ureae]SEQ11278.1 Nucleotide-binding universal stress protein, UspA family [Nitrosomonas ureae]SOD21006.1 Nucleotide-binding universal stress protein, UspA family [Nitrosomonas ureae]